VTEPFALRSWRAADGLRLSARDYAGVGGEARVPVVCIHGLTRNSRDFEELAPWIAGQGRRVLTPDMRGRGLSERDPNAANYAIPVYVGDIAALLDQAGIAQAIFLGTSMGGLVTMGLAGLRPQAIAGAVLNDVGPEIDPAGLARIASYAGARPATRNWDEAAARARTINELAFPHYGPEDWMRFARRTFRDGTDGAPEPDYDVAISGMAGPLDRGAEAYLWSLYMTLAATAPVLVLRGETSDILRPDTARRMAQAGRDARLVTVRGVGHAPMLDEPEAREALEAFLRGAP
jgi:pimeloyl-ACP methyl ester carboxylesterase